MKTNHSTFFVILILVFIVFNQCSSDVDNKKGNVTSFSIERDNVLRNWRTFELVNESISTPSDWEYKIDKQSFILFPIDRKNEFLEFLRISKNSSNIDYKSLALKLSENSFDSYTSIESDTITSVELEKGFYFERSVHFNMNEKKYQGYYLIYIGSENMYSYKIILSSETLNLYDGDLIKDIIGNIKINNKYMLSNENKMINISVIRNRHIGYIDK